MAEVTLILSEETLKERSSVHSNIDAKLITPYIKIAQDIHIEPILGTTLYKKILSLIPNLTGDYKNLVDDYIIEPLIHFTLYYLPVSLSLQYYNRGIQKKSGDNADAVTMQELRELQNDSKRIAEFYGNKLKDYLKEKSTSSFLPEYILSDSGCNIVQPECKVYTTPFCL